ncbi:MAG: DUF151 domain-containing protein, partial [Actinomycetota bacterium]|nr:DUF151 domain-containing protein [Actinomycetota bacterium]
HRAGLLASCGRLLRDDALAEDAAQEATVTAFLDLDRLRRPERFGAWLIGIGLNIGRRWLRARPREAWPARDGAAEVLTATEPGPAETAEARELAVRVRRAVAALPSGQRRAVVGYYLLGLPQREVAALLGTSIGAVKTRLHKARVSLTDALADDWMVREEHAMSEGEAVAMQVSDVCRAELDTAMSYVVILEEVEGPRALPIWVGEPEGTALAAALTEADVPRPMTHWLAAALLDAGGVALRSVRVTRLAEHTFYATVTVGGSRGPVEVDARPSDALTIAVLTDTPITVDEAVLRITDAQVREEGVPTAAQVRAQAQQHAADITATALAEHERRLAELCEPG